MEKERLGWEASFGGFVEEEGQRRECCDVSLVASTADMLSGVSGLLMKKTLSPSSVVESSTSSVAAATDLASKRVGRCFSSGNILLNALGRAEEPSLADIRSLVILAVKNCVYSVSLSVLAQ